MQTACLYPMASTSKNTHWGPASHIHKPVIPPHIPLVFHSSLQALSLQPHCSLPLSPSWFQVQCLSQSCSSLFLPFHEGLPPSLQVNSSARFLHGARLWPGQLKDFNVNSFLMRIAYVFRLAVISCRVRTAFLFFFSSPTECMPKLSTSVSSVQFSRSVVSDSLQPHELQHARPPCPSPTPGVHPNPCPWSWWCHPAISSSVVPFFFCPQSFPASGSFPISQLFACGGQSIGVSASTSVLPMNIQDWFPLWWSGWITLQSKGHSRVFSNTTVQKHQFFGALLSSPSNSHIHTWLLEKP